MWLDILQSRLIPLAILSKKYLKLILRSLKLDILMGGSKRTKVLTERKAMFDGTDGFDVRRFGIRRCCRSDFIFGSCPFP